VGKEARSLGNLFMFRESKKSLKTTPRGSFFVYPCGSEKEIKVYRVHSHVFYEHEKEQTLISVCPQLEKLVA
jgi:hypothetical protein